MVDYHRCDRCAHMWSPEHRGWSIEDFAARIYNAEYGKVDPDYLDRRPRGNADMLEQMLGKHKEVIRHLDYGGGNGLLSHLLKERGWQSRSWDPYTNEGELWSGQYDLVTCFEVFEHEAHPDRLVNALMAVVDEPGLIFFSTALSDGAVRDKLEWWYAAPRNGHVSLYSERSLHALFRPFGFAVASLSSNFHMAFRNPPPWALETFARSA